jgi:hypothetical protein
MTSGPPPVQCLACADFDKEVRELLRRVAARSCNQMLPHGAGRTSAAVECRVSMNFRGLQQSARVAINCRQLAGALSGRVMRCVGWDHDWAAPPLRRV